MDPHNVDAFLAAAFWVAGHGGSPDVAEGILMEAQRNNPTDYRVFREKASLLMRLGRWEDACSALEAGIKLWPGSTDPSERQAAADLTRMLDERSVLAVRGGDMKTAVEFARKALARAPDHDHLAWRIEAIERGESLDGWADKALAGLARRYTDQVEHECPRAGAHEHEHDGEHVHNHEHGPRCGHDH
jgi:tetratricopeptide (TPR) repeat protein